LFLVAVSGVRDEDSGLASSLANTGQQVGGAIGLAALGTIVWGAVAHSTRTQLAHAAAAAARAGQPVPALRSSAQIPLPILHHALASDISRGFVVGAGIMLAAVRPGRRAQRPHRHAVTALLWEGTVSSVGSGPAIVVDGLTKSFGDVRALRGIDLAVPHATVLGLLGPNGAGRTTTVRILTTLLGPDSGRPLAEARDRAHQAAAGGRSIGLSGQSAAIQEELTGRQNLEIIGRLYHLSWPDARAKLCAELDKCGDLSARTLDRSVYVPDH